MGQPAKQSRDDFKDVQEVEVLSYQKFQKKFCGEAFFGMSSFKTNVNQVEKSTLSIPRRILNTWTISNFSRLKLEYRGFVLSVFPHK